MHVPGMCMILAYCAVFLLGLRLASCAGVAVLADMLLTTHFMTLVLLTVWKVPLWVCLLFYIAFAPIEAAFWTSTLTKVPNGAFL